MIRMIRYDTANVLRAGGLFSIVLAFFGHALAWTQPVVDMRYTDRIDEARDILLEALQSNRTPGAAVTVSIDGEVVWSEGFGKANLELNVPATPSTKFRIGSISKALTAGALTLLVQDSRLDLDQPVQQYVPSFPQKRFQITTRQVAGHMAGIRHYRGNEFLSQKRYETVLDGLTMFRDDTLLFEPGSRYAYSSYGFNLVSAVIEGASGKPFLEFMAERMFRPFGMESTVAEYPDSIIIGRSAFYSVGPVHTNAPMVDNSYKWAGGGFLSTTEDLIRYANAVMTSPLFTDDGRKLMFTPQSLADGKRITYSVGWVVRKEGDHLWILHGGGSVGGSARLLLVPEKRIALALLCNDDSRFVSSGDRALRVFL